MEVIKYEIKNKIINIGFKENDFVIYTSILYNENLTKTQLLQQAYIKIYKDIKYEQTQNTHNLNINKKGEEFIPEKSKPIKLEIDFNKLEGKALDQYGNIYSTDIQFSIEGTDKAVITNNKVVEQDVTENIIYYIIATYKYLVKKQKRIIYTKKEPKIVNDQIDDEKIALAEAIIDLNNRVQKLEGGN